MKWLKFFRVVNLPTVPGDVLVGVSAAAFGGCAMMHRSALLAVAAACLASVFIYMFGLADNDLLGAATDTGRPLPDGEITLAQARWARGLCLLAALVTGALADLPPAWWVAVLLLTGIVVLYNRTKWCVPMGLCRGLNVLCGGAFFWRSGGANDLSSFAWVISAAVLWTLYIAAVTRYSEGESLDPARRHRVGLLIGALVYLQLAALLFFAVKPLLLTGAVMLVLARLTKRLLPEVSAS